jgi:hypothetical protein
MQKRGAIFFNRLIFSQCGIGEMTDAQAGAPTIAAHVGKAGSDYFFVCIGNAVCVRGEAAEIAAGFGCAEIKNPIVTYFPKGINFDAIATGGVTWLCSAESVRSSKAANVILKPFRLS